MTIHDLDCHGPFVWGSNYNLHQSISKILAHDMHDGVKQLVVTWNCQSIKTKFANEPY